MKSYYRIILGAHNSYVQEHLAGNFISVGYSIYQDLTHRLVDDKRAFNRELIPIYFSNHPGKSKVTAALACGTVWTVSKGMQIGDIVISPDEDRHYHVGEITGPYYYVEGEMQHRRPVHWFVRTFRPGDMSAGLWGIVCARSTLINLTKYGPEIDKLIGSGAVVRSISTH